MAPPPTLEATDEAIRRTVAASCGDDEQSLLASILPGRVASSRSMHATEPVLSVRVTWDVIWISGNIASARIVQSQPPGAPPQVERPPD
jgi:hypothetical protein